MIVWINVYSNRYNIKMVSKNNVTIKIKICKLYAEKDLFSRFYCWTENTVTLVITIYHATYNM